MGKTKWCARLYQSSHQYQTVQSNTTIKFSKTSATNRQSETPPSKHQHSITASLIIGAGILTYVHVKDRKAKKLEKAREAQDARYTELQMGHTPFQAQHGQPTIVVGQAKDMFAEPPAYTEALPRRSSSVYSQGSNGETRTR